MYMILFVLHDTSQLEDVLTAWEQCGVGGVTILPSTGLVRFRQYGPLRDDLPLFPSLDDVMAHVQNSNRTLLTIVENDERVERVVAATQEVTGDLSQPNTGILAVLPLARVYGLNHTQGEER